MKTYVAIGVAVMSSFSLMAQASSKSVTVPSLFDVGPAPIVAIKLSANEVAGVMLLESVMDIASSAALVGGCKALEASYAVEISVDGEINQPETNIAKITSPGSSEPLVLNGAIAAKDSFIGQNIDIRLAKSSKLKEIIVSDYISVASVNSEFTLLSISSNAKMPGQNNIPTPHQNTLIKNFYEQKNPDNKNYILGWGLESLSRSGYPINKYWVGFKALRVDEQLKRVVLQQDSLIGSSICHVGIDSSVEVKKDDSKENKKTLILKGVMTIKKPDSVLYRSDAFDF